MLKLIVTEPAYNYIAEEEKEKINEE